MMAWQLLMLAGLGDTRDRSMGGEIKGTAKYEGDEYKYQLKHEISAHRSFSFSAR